MADALWPFADEFRAWHTSRSKAPQSFFWLSNEFHEANCPLTFQGTTETLLQLFDVEAETPYPVSQHPFLNDDFVCWLQLPSDVVGTEWYFGAVTFDRRRHRRKLFDDFRELAAKCGACLRQNPRFREWLWPCMQYLTQADRHPKLRENEDVAWWVALLFTKPNLCGLLHEACTRHDITALEIARFQIDNPAHWSKEAIRSHQLFGDPFWPMVGCRVALPFRDIPCPDFIEATEVAQPEPPAGEKTPKSQQRAIESTADIKSSDKFDGQSDTSRKLQKKSKRRLLDRHGNACIKEFKAYVKRGDRQSMLYVVKEYVEEHAEVKESSLLKSLYDNSDQWKPKSG